MTDEPMPDKTEESNKIAADGTPIHMKTMERNYYGNLPDQHIRQQYVRVTSGAGEPEQQQRSAYAAQSKINGAEGASVSFSATALGKEVLWRIGKDRDGKITAQEELREDFMPSIDNPHPNGGRLIFSKEIPVKQAAERIRDGFEKFYDQHENFRTGELPELLASNLSGIRATMQDLPGGYGDAPANPRVPNSAKPLTGKREF